MILYGLKATGYNGRVGTIIKRGTKKGVTPERYIVELDGQEEGKPMQVSAAISVTPRSHIISGCPRRLRAQRR